MRLEIVTICSHSPIRFATNPKVRQAPRIRFSTVAYNTSRVLRPGRTLWTRPPA